MIKKIDSSNIPDEILKDLNVLKIDNYKEFILVGKNFYELFPTQSLKLLNIIGDVIDMISVAKQMKIEKLRMLGYEEDAIKSDYISIQDVLAVDSNKDRIKVVMHEILEGVDDSDFTEMTISQVLDILSKLVKINIESFPDAFKYQFFKTIVDSSKLVDTTSANLKTKEEEERQDFLEETPTI